MRLSALVLGLVLAVSMNSAPQHDLNLVVHSYPADHFSISVPADWVEIPEAELDQMTANARRLAPQLKQERFSHGFQARRDATYPRVVVLVRTSGRWSEDSIFEMAAMKKEEVQRNVNSASPALASMNPQVGRMTWDPKAHIAWVRMQFTGKEGRPMTGLAGLHPTEAGAIQVNGYAAEPDFDRVATTFTAIITSVKIDEQLRYRERSALSRVAPVVGGPALTGLVVGTGVILLIRARRRSRKPEAMKPHSRKAHIVGAAWKLPLGTLLLLGQFGTIQNALAGDGWLQKSGEAQGYWFGWGLMVCLAASVIYLGSRDLLAARK